MMVLTILSTKLAILVDTEHQAIYPLSLSCSLYMILVRRGTNNILRVAQLLRQVDIDGRLAVGYDFLIEESRFELEIGRIVWERSNRKCILVETGHDAQLHHFFLQRISLVRLLQRSLVNCSVPDRHRGFCR